MVRGAFFSWGRTSTTRLQAIVGVEAVDVGPPQLPTVERRPCEYCRVNAVAQWKVDAGSLNPAMNGGWNSTADAKLAAGFNQCSSLPGNTTTGNATVQGKG